MHIERNICLNILKHLFGEKDTAACRKDMEAAFKFPHLHLQARPGSSDFIKPHAPYVFTEEERNVFLALISSTRVPSGYSSTLIKHAGENRLGGLKSHDHHCLIQQVLPAAVRHLLDSGVRETVIRLGHLFQRLCARVIDLALTRELETYAAETLCLVELNFPPGFFDTMIHLPIHLPVQLALCGPVHLHWCYGIERYMGVLTSYVRDMSKPEAYMASGYMVDESLGFCTEYFQLYQHTRRRIWDPFQELKDTSEVLQGKAKRVVLGHLQMTQIHDYVVEHSVHTAELMRCASYRRYTHFFHVSFPLS
jgi:hypothetical protein